ncbi:hypothetical protein [Sphingomonas endophytica]|nr:hypothetical protein [Sphingomonas endophytica]
MSLKHLKTLISTAPIYKMSLGKHARYRTEALSVGALVFQSEQSLYDAVVAEVVADIAAAARTVKADKYPNANAPENAWGVWVRTIQTFRELPPGALILHWEGEEDRLHWGIVDDGPFIQVRTEHNEFAQDGYIFHRPLRDGWKTTSVHGVPISNIHPHARPFAINMATLNFVQNNGEYFRALILDESIDHWTSQPDWAAGARAAGWHPKPIEPLRAARRARTVTADVIEAAQQVFTEIELFTEVTRMAGTALHTAAYANGQTELRVIKAKEIDFTRAELEEEIADLLRRQENRCALTGFSFRTGEINPHLKMSLDRKNSNLGYIADNLQVVTRAANFYKSASDDADWAQKADALHRMAVALQQLRKAAKDPDNVTAPHSKSYR